MWLGAIPIKSDFVVIMNEFEYSFVDITQHMIIAFLDLE